MSNIDRRRAQSLMQAGNIEALVLFQPEAFHYAIGAPAGVATMWGRAGSAAAFVPADAALPLAAIASDHASAVIRQRSPGLDLRTHRIWIDSVDLQGVTRSSDIDGCYQRSGGGGPRPETFDRSLCFNLLGDVLAERGLASGRIGVDLEFMPAADFEALRLALPKVTWVDGSEVLRRLRAVKTPVEISRLRRAARAA